MCNGAGIFLGFGRDGELSTCWFQTHPIKGGRDHDQHAKCRIGIVSQRGKWTLTLLLVEYFSQVACI